MTQISGTETRRQERSVANGVATIRAASGRFSGALVDLSEGGLQVLCQAAVVPGEPVEVRFTPEGYPKEIAVQAKVTRIQPDRVAIEFAQCSSWDQAWQEITAFYAPEVRQNERYTADASASVYIAPNRARGHVEDVSRSGMQIRSDIAASVGSAAEVRFTPRGQAEEITAAGRVARVRGDRIGIAFPETSSWQSSWRKMVAFRTVSQKKQEGPLTPELLLSKVAEIQRAAAASNEIDEKTAALWKMESLGVTLGRIVQPGESLNDPRLPVGARPIVHVGMGGAAVEAADFDASEIKRIIDSVAHPEYRLFAYEQIGAMLGVYEKTVPRLMLGLKRLNRPDPAKFIPLFSPEVQRLISHGYGRLLYFNSKDVQAALRNIQKRTFLDRRAAMQGAAFGYTMVNHLELGVVLETGDSLLDPELVKAFKSGLVYALEFWEWVSPGFLDSLRFDSPRANTLIEAARREIAAARVQGWLDPFVVHYL